jgi:hypothetical protein
LHLVGELFELYDDARTYKPYIYVVLSLPLIRKPIISHINPVYNPSILFLSFFLLSYSDLFLPTHCRSSGLLLHLVTFNDTQTHTHTHPHTHIHTLYRSSLNEGSALRRPLPDNTKHAQTTEIHDPDGI